MNVETSDSSTHTMVPVVVACMYTVDYLYREGGVPLIFVGINTNFNFGRGPFTIHSPSKRVSLNVLPYEQPKGLVITHKEYRTKFPILEHVVTSGLALDFGRS